MTTASWNTAADGSAPLAPWVNGNTAVFSAGSDATGEFAVNITSSVTAAGVTVEEGTVSLTGSALNVGASTITVNSGAKLSIASGSQITATAGATIVLDGGTFRNTGDTTIPATQVFVDPDVTINVAAAGGAVETANTGGTHATIFTGKITGAGNTLRKTGTGEFRFQGANTATANFSKLSVEGGLYRLGNVSGNNSEVGFGAAPATFTPDAVTLSGGGSIGANYAVTLNVNRGVTLGAGGGGFDTSGANMVVPSVITGSGDLLKDSSGQLSLTGNNTYTGKTIVNSGIIVVGSANALGSTAGITQVNDGGEVRVDGLSGTFTIPEPFSISGSGNGGAINVINGASPTFTGPVTVEQDATISVGTGSRVTFTNTFNVPAVENLTVQGAGTGTINGAVNLGGGGLNKTGDGTWILGGNSTFTGVTYVEKGTLVVNGSISGTSQVTVSGRLAGSGTITMASAGSIPLQNGGELSPGFDLTPGNLQIALSGGGAFDLVAGVTDPLDTQELIFKLGAVDASDKITITGGALNIGPGVLEFNDFKFIALGGYAPGDYTLFDGTNAIVGTLGANKSGLAGQFLANIQFGDNNKDIVLHVIPEPTSAGLLIGSLGLLINRRRRQRG